MQSSHLTVKPLVAHWAGGEEEDRERAGAIQRELEEPGRGGGPLIYSACSPDKKQRHNKGSNESIAQLTAI